ncbi:MAG TPA: DNA polymerase/3'-5' exonuclease PolX [Gemmatimonadales bacterium]
MENAEIARLFRELADLLDIEGANPFRVRAYRTAARTLEAHPEPVAELAANTPKMLTELPGIGDDLAGKIVEIVRTGRLGALEEAGRRVPHGLASLLRVPGLGPKRVQTLFHTLGVRTPGELRQACQAGRVAELRGFGEKLEQRLLKDLSEHRAERERLPRPAAAQYAEAILEHVRSAPGLLQAEWAGSFRRCKDTVGDLDLLVSARRAEPVIDRFLAYPEVDQILAHGGSRAAVRLRSGLQIDLRVLDAECYGAGLYYFTGSKAHNIAVRRLAQARGLKVNEYGVWRGQRRIAGRTEREVVEAIGLPLIPPELREDRGEVEAARAGALPRLVKLQDIRGDLQCHTTASDGRDSLAAMAHAAQAQGYQYLAITDHTPHVRVAGGLDREGFRLQRKAIDKLNRTLSGFTILAGAEVDILRDGDLDLDDETLRSLDIVVISLHSALALPRREQTRRVLKALANPAVDILAHPTGRLLGRRAGADLDLSQVARAAADRGVMLEVNAQPDRLDLDDEAIRAVLQLGVRLTISTDAHAAAELAFMRWGVDQARRGWASPAQVANTLPLAAFQSLLHGARSSAPPGAERAAWPGTSDQRTAPAKRATARVRRGRGPGRPRSAHRERRRTRAG